MKLDLLKDKLLVLNEQLEMERDSQHKMSFGSQEYSSSLKKEASMLEEKKQLLEKMKQEVEVQLNIN